MAKSKSSSKPAKAEAPAAALKSVKAGRVTKPAEDSKKSKGTAKTAAKAHQKAAEKKRKDSVKSDSDSDSDATSDSSASSAGDSDSEMSLDEKPAKVNGSKKAAAKTAEPDSSDSDSSESDSEAEAPKAKTNGASKAAAAAKADSSDSSDDSESDEEEEKKPATNGVKATKKAAAKAASSDDSASDSDASSADEKVVTKAAAKADADSDDSEADSDSDASSSDEEEEEKPAAKAPEQKKRKAETELAAPVKRVKQNGEPVSEPSKNLFVGSLSWNVDEDWLQREFEGFGNIVGVRIITDRDSGRSKGFGYVEFDDIEGATAALDAKQGAEIDGRQINIDFGKVRPDRSYNNEQVSARANKFGDRAPAEPSNTVFVGNISFNADQDMISEAFSEYGTVNGVRLPTDPESGQMKGFGYVEFGSIEEAQAAVEGLNGADIAGRNIRLDFAGARPATGDSPRGGRGGFGGGRGRGGFDRGGRGGGRGRGGDRGRGRGGGRGNFSTNRGGFGDFKGKKISF